MNTDNQQLPLETVAKQLQTTTLNLLLHIKRGLLTATEEQGQWYVSTADLKDFLARAQPLKPGVICASSGCGKGCGSCAED